MLKSLYLLLAISITQLFSSEKPNFVVILVDDMPWSGTEVDMQEGLRGSKMPFRHTPNLNRLAKMGMTFSRAYASAGMCAPSRCSFQTGTTPARNRFTGNGNFGETDIVDLTYDERSRFRNNKLLNPYPIGTIQKSATTIGEALKKECYATAHFGKWHIYGKGPGEHGYDEHDGETSNDEGKIVKERDPKLMFSMTESAIGFIEKNHKNQTPFYCQISHYAEHNPCQALPETIEKYSQDPFLEKLEKPNQKKDYINRSAMIENFDQTVGMVIDHLEKLNLMKNTYIIFTADNGYYRFNDGHELLRGSKWWLWEAGIRVPMIMTGPGIAEGSRSHHNIVGYDFLPTFVDLAKGDVSTLKDIDGLSFKSVILNQSISSEFQDRALYFHYPHHRTSAMHSAIIQGDDKLLYFYELPNKFFLYDLKKDVSESNNISQQYPEKTKSLFKRLNQYLDSVDAFMPKENPQASEDYQPYDPDTMVADHSSKK